MGVRETKQLLKKCTLTPVDGEIIMLFQTLTTRETSNARLALALTRLAVTCVCC